MEETKSSNPSPEKPTDKDYKKKRVEEIGSTLAQIKARVKANRSCTRKDDELSGNKAPREILSEKSEKYIQVLELDKAKAQKLEKERPKMKEAIENMMIDRENQKLVEKKIEETRAKQSAPLPEIPVEVQKRISELEITNHNLRETLSDKEKVLESKTESWRLLGDQLERRNMEAVEKSELMVKEIEEVKKRYAEQEVFLKQELEKCKTKLQDADSLLISKENEKRDFEELKKELSDMRTVHQECETRISESKKAQEAERRLAIKLKAQLKNLRNESNNQKDLSSEVETLKNVIATLEDEKGNLLLQLVDFDDAKESASKNVERLKEMEDYMKTMETELISTRERYDLLNEEFKVVSSKLVEDEDTITTLKEALEQMQQLKITSEFKAAELEEKLECENREDRSQSEKMLKEMDNLKCHMTEQEELVDQLKTLIVQKEAEIVNLKENRKTEMEYSFGYNTQDLKDLLEEWKIKYSSIEKNVQIVQDEKDSLLVKVQSLQDELELAKIASEKYDSEIKEKESQYAELVLSMTQSTERISQLEAELSRLARENQDKKQPAEPSQDQTQKLKKLAANLKIKVKLCKELEEKIAGLNDRIVEYEKNVATINKEKMNLESLVSEYKQKLENVSVDSDVVNQLRQLVTEKETIIQSLREQNFSILQVETATLARVRSESLCEISEKESTIKHLKEENLILESKLNENLIEIHSVDESDSKAQIKVEEDAQTLLEEEKDSLLCQINDSVSKIQTLTADLEEKTKKIQEMEKTLIDLNEQLNIANVYQTDSKIVFEQQTKEIEHLKDQLNRLKYFGDSTVVELTERETLRQQIKTLQIELERSKAAVNSKEEIITRFESEMNEFRSELNQKEIQLFKMQELYEEESLRNDGVMYDIEQFQAELNFNKDEIVFLSEQLSAVSRSYKESMDNLSEKDKHIDTLEKELETMKNKVYKLETSIEERQKTMEDRAKQLGEKLNQAATANVNFEHYQTEMDQKLSCYNEIEKKLNIRMSELLEQLEGSRSANEELARMNRELEERGKMTCEKVASLESELSEIKSSYNTTLDQIEMLNEELKQVMAQIEHRNQELVRIGEERNALVDKLNQLEDTCLHLKTQLENNEAQSETLKTELDTKLKELDIATTEINNLQSQLGTNQLTETNDLNRELEILKMEYEERLRELQIEKEDLLKVLKGSVETEVNSLMEAAEDKVESSKSEQTEIKMFSWDGHTDDGPLTDIQEGDGWGWNASEAKLEEEHHNKVRELENEKERFKTDNEQLAEEVKTLKIKCNKLVTKVKEMKAANEREKSKTGFEDLNFAMQEELRSQVDELDSKNKELSSEIVLFKTEKERLLKRVETLTSANNQLIEMKERQDIEVQVWQRNCAELKNQLQTFDWTETETKPEPKVSTGVSIVEKTYSELEDKLTFLETENEELLQIICSLKDEKQASSNLATELNNLKQENKLLKETQQHKISNSNPLENEITELKLTLDKEREELQNKNVLLEQITTEKRSLEQKLHSINMELENSQEHCNSLVRQMGDYSVSNEQTKSDYDSIASDLEVKNNQILTLNENINLLEGNVKQLAGGNEKLKVIVEEKGRENERLMNELSQLNVATQQMSSLENELMQVSKEIDRLKGVVETLKLENNTLKESYDFKVVEIDMLRADMKLTEASKDAALSDVENLKEELGQMSVDQSGAREVTSSSGSFDAPLASSIFEGITSVFNMSNTREDNVTPVAGMNIPGIQDKKLYKNDSFVASSPPVFKGFFSDQNDPFAFPPLNLVQLRTEVKEEPFVPQKMSQGAIIHSVPITGQEIVQRQIDPSELDNLKERVCQLEQENLNLMQRLNSLITVEHGSTDLTDIKIKEKENEIVNLQTEIYNLNENIRNISVRFDLEKGEIVRNLREKIEEYESQLGAQTSETDNLKMELDKMKRDHEIQIDSIRSNDMQAMQEGMHEELRQKELNFQNSLLNKDEENAHLVCELSAKQVALEKFTSEVETFKTHINSLENQLKSSIEQNEAILNQVNSLRHQNDQVSFENNELRKVKENDNQLYAAQIDYLQQSVQEKDSFIENLNERCNELINRINTLQEEVRVSTEKSSYLDNCYSSLNAAHNDQNLECSSLRERLTAATNEIEHSNASVSSLTQELNHHRALLEDEKLSHESLRTKEQDQVRLLTTEIELLQSQITEKDLEIERLSKVLTGLQEKLIKTEESKVTDEVLKLGVRLDEALYTLHLRDVRCDELTIEIMQLLEERDSLQLKLSQALRSNESLKISVNQPSESEPTSLGSQPESTASQDLTNKFVELHTGYMKDPGVKMDRQSRYSQQMHLYTPQDTATSPEAARNQESSGSDYGILNWFFSSSTPPQPGQDPVT